MARPLRLEFPGAVYHVTSRGNGRAAIYLDDEDREAFLNILGEACRRMHWVGYAYCLMTNHYHLVIETLEPNLSRGMRQLNGVYTQQFNRHHGRVGHVFQGRYKAILVDRESHLLERVRYGCLTLYRPASLQVKSTGSRVVGQFGCNIAKKARGYVVWVAMGAVLYR